MSDELPPLNVEWTNVFKRDIAGVLSINLRDEVLRILDMLSQTTHKSLTFLFSLSFLLSFAADRELRLNNKNSDTFG